MNTFKVRPGYQSKALLIEFNGEHCAKDFPNVKKLLEKGLSSRRESRLNDFKANLYDFDGYTTTWKYKNGTYEINNDVWTLFIHAEQNNKVVIADIENVLLDSGVFLKEEVDFSEYT